LKKTHTQVPQVPIPQQDNRKKTAAPAATQKKGAFFRIAASAPKAVYVSMRPSGTLRRKETHALKLAPPAHPSDKSPAGKIMVLN